MGNVSIFRCDTMIKEEPNWREEGYVVSLDRLKLDNNADKEEALP